MGNNQHGVVHCPNGKCQKPIISQAAMAEGTSFVMKCANCQSKVRIIVGFNVINKKLLLDINQRTIINTEGQEGSA